MKRKNKFILSLALLLCSFISINDNKIQVNASIGDAPTIKYSATLSESYYDSVANLKGEALLEQLAVITKENHQYYTTYEEIKGGNAYSDKDPNDSTKLIDFYTGWSIPNDWDAGDTWNREHVWCQSLSGGLYGTSGAGSDIHHIRPTISSINTDRNNGLYTDRTYCGDISLTSYTYKGSEVAEYKGLATGCYNSGQSYFEPRDSVKGDVARILMYMYMHYSKQISANETYSYAGNLAITKIVYTEDKTADKAFELLLSWNEIDPVDDFERNRNNYCASVTGVRNPFIDHPEYATSIWENGANSGAKEEEKPDETVYQLVMSNEELQIGDTIIIASNNKDAALSITQKTNNRAAIDIVKYTDGENNYLTANSDTQLITLEEGKIDNTYAFNVGNGYLYASSSSNNYLKTETNLSNNSSWSIEINNGVAKVISKGNNTRNHLRHNSSSSLFSCYAETNSQGDVAIYKKSDTVPGETITPPEYEFPEANATLTIKEALKAADEAGSSYTINKYYITGTIEKIDSTKYGNMTIKDSAGDSIYVYGVYNEDGTILYESLDYKPQVGDEVTLYGILGMFNSTHQMKDGWLVKENSSHKHEYGEITYTWNNDYSECIASRTCKDNDHEEVEKVTSRVNKVDPTCDQKGSIVYVASFTNEEFETQTYVKEIEALGHNYDNGVISKKPTELEEGIRTYTCNCGHSYTESIDKLPAKNNGCKGTTSSVFSLLALASMIMLLKKKK